jgi:pre-mRNA-processing factor SLU7
MSSSAKLSHTTESFADRKKQQEVAQARQAGTLAPAVDAKTGSMINPHNPEFITKKPWYLGGNADQNSNDPTLEHQAVAEETPTLSLMAAEELLSQQRLKHKARVSAKKYVKGQWVEALKKNRMPYRICKILNVNKQGTEFDLEFEDGVVERKVKVHPRAEKPRVRMTKSGSRAEEFVMPNASSGSSNGAIKQTYDSKRDAYHGYDKDSHNQKLAKKFEIRESFRRKVQEDSSKDKTDTKGNDSDSDFDDSDDSDVGSDDSEDEFVQRDEDAKVLTTRLARQGGVGGAQMKVTARNLRIREDTAKYLRNLDPNSAYYDPKSRSMRDNPHPEVDPTESQFAGDNFARISGDAVQLADTQLFAWDATGKGVDEIHPQANPSQAEVLKRTFESKAKDMKLERKKRVLDKYGGAEYLDGQGGLASATETEKKAVDMAQERKLRFGVQTKAEMYSRDGRIEGGTSTKREAISSKYEEDILSNGHTTVWGSYFHKGAFQWGYADDHSLLKASYCTGENGRIANDEANEMRYGTGVAGSAALAQARGMLKSYPGRVTNESKLSAAPVNRSKLYGEADPKVQLDEAKLKEALSKEVPKEIVDDRKRKYHSMNAEVEMTEEDMEAYRLLKDRKSDPMANIGSDDILDYK